MQPTSLQFIGHSNWHLLSLQLPNALSNILLRQLCACEPTKCSGKLETRFSSISRVNCRSVMQPTSLQFIGHSDWHLLSLQLPNALSNILLRRLCACEPTKGSGKLETTLYSLKLHFT